MATAHNDTYERNPVNISSLGTDFETNVAIYSVLTLLNSDQQAIAIEYKSAPSKFDDVVLRVKNDANNYEYYYRQLKHKDTKKNPDAYLTWNDLLRTKNPKIPKEKNPPFGIPYYYECFLAQQNQLSLNGARELGFVTNYKLVNKQGSSSVNNLEDLAQRLLYPSPKEATYHITEGDLQTFFKEWTWSCTPPRDEQKSYRFTEAAVDAIFKGTRAGLLAANKTLDLTLYETFLGLLVFHVSMPHVDELKPINQQLLKLFFPFHKKSTRDKYGDIEERFKELFDDITRRGQKRNASSVVLNSHQGSCKNQANWATVKGRSELFEEMASTWENEVSIELPTQFELVDYVAKPELDSKFREIFDAPKPWAVRIDAMPVVNIYNADSNSFTIALKVLKTLEYYALNESKTTQYTPPQGRFKIMQVSDKQSVDKIMEYFKDLNEEVSNCADGLSIESFCYIIQIFPFNEWTEQTQTQLAQSLNGLIDLRKWIQFVIVTQQPMLINGKQDNSDLLMRIKDDPLQWQNLSENYKALLFEKTLHLCDNNETSLRALGLFERDTVGGWLNSRALSELIAHDDKKPLNLGLPKKDASLETDYIERDIQLPLVKTDSANYKNKSLFTCNEAEFYSDGSVHRDQSASQTVEYEHLLSPVDSGRYKNVRLWVKSKEAKSILGLKHFVIHSKKSDVTIHETQLLEENVNFGTGSSDNKLIVVVDYPGKGKSCLLTSLSNRLIDKWSNQSNDLLLRVNLREIKQWRDCGNGIEFLVSHSNCFKRVVMTEKTCLTEAIVSRKCTIGPPSVFVFLDGYDEVSDEQRSKTLKVINDLLEEEGIKRIILTSRPEANLEGELEQHFRQFSLHLKNFDRKDQIDYLTKRWKSKVENYCGGTGLEKKIEKYAEALVHFAGTTLKDENKTFLDIPLQCWIFSECFYQQLKQFLMSGNETVPQFNEDSFEILNLYDQFLEAKMDVLLQEKANIQFNSNNGILSFLRDDIKKVYLRSLERLSVLHLMGNKTDEAACICRLHWEKYKNNAGADVSESSSDLLRTIKLGVVQGFSEDKEPCSATDENRNIKFLHRTFAEYCFARYLSRNFIRKESELFDDTIYKEELIDKSLEIIAGKILVAPQFAGVRRFLDRMLAKQIPPAGELCPFANNQDRSVVFKKWPVIGHERFNEQLAKSFILQNATDYEELSFRSHLSANQLSEEGYEQLSKQSDRKKDVAIILGAGSEKEPFLTSVLLHCIKEYASRQETSNDEREKLAYSVTLSSLILVANTDDEKKISGEITNSLVHWFDPTTKLPSAKNKVFAKWIFIILNVFSHEREGSNYFKLDLVAAICKALEYHENYPHFEESIYAIVTSRLFAMRDELNKKYNTPFFEIRHEEFWFKKRCEEPRFTLKRENRAITDSLFEGIFIVSVGARMVSFPNLLQRLADFLVAKLSQHIKPAAQYRNKLYFYIGSLKNANNLIQNKKEDVLLEVKQALDIYIDSNEKFVYAYVVRPYAFIETVKFFMIKSKLPKSTAAKLQNVSFEYIVRIQTDVLFRMMHLGNLSQVMGLAEPIAAKWNSTYSSTMLWYFLVYDAILPFISDTADDTRIQRIHSVFFTEIGQKSLTAYAHATCCCQCEHKDFSGFGIHFPRDEDCNSDSVVGPFRSLFADKLKFLWNRGRAEMQLIDFLFKGYEFVTEDERKFERSNQDQISTGYYQSTCNTLEEAESRLRAIHLSKLPCLLFSDVVAEYIPQKLSPTGLNHIINTLKALPLISCERNCFYFLEDQFIPVIINLKMSILDGIIQEDVTSPRIFKCKHRADRVKALQEKLMHDATTAQL